MTKAVKVRRGKKKKPDYGVYHSLVDGPGPCPLCSSYEAVKGHTDTRPPVRIRYYRCNACGYNFRSIEIDSRFVVENWPQVFSALG